MLCFFRLPLKKILPGIDVLSILLLKGRIYRLYGPLPLYITTKEEYRELFVKLIVTIAFGVLLKGLEFTMLETIIFTCS